MKDEIKRSSRGRGYIYSSKGNVRAATSNDLCVGLLLEPKAISASFIVMFRLMLPICDFLRFYVPEHSTLSVDTWTTYYTWSISQKEYEKECIGLFKCFSPGHISLRSQRLFLFWIGLNKTSIKTLALKKKCQMINCKPSDAILMFKA